MEQVCTKCGTRWVSNSPTQCPTCQDTNLVQLSGKLVMVDPKDYHFTLEQTVTQRPMTKWERFLDWLANLVSFKRIF